MGIRGLGRFLTETVPECIRHQDIKAFLGQAIAIDASMSLYQFVIAIRDAEGYGSLTNDAGEETSHISGFLARCTRLLENGIKPVYIFDGKPCDLKQEELEKRRLRRSKAKEEFEAAQDAGDVAAMKKFSGRTVKITAQHNLEVKELLSLLGVPTLDAPSEAEAQCAAIARAGLVYGTATEDTDALTFGSPILIRHLSFSDQQSKNKPILVFTLSKILEKLQLTMAEFIDFCILCGCDYCDRLKGVGPHTAYKLIKKHSTIEKVLEVLAKTPEELQYYDYVKARNFFLKPEVLDVGSIPKLVWQAPQEDKLRALLTERYNFSGKRVDSYLMRLNQARGRSSQLRLDAFFGAAVIKLPSTPIQDKSENQTARKRKTGTTVERINQNKKKK